MKEEASKEMYVVVNLSSRITMGDDGEHYVMGDEARTHGTLHSAAQLVNESIKEHDHTVASARIFKLTPVSLDKINMAVEECRKEDEAE